MRRGSASSASSASSETAKRGARAKSFARRKNVACEEFLSFLSGQSYFRVPEIRYLMATFRYHFTYAVPVLTPLYFSHFLGITDYLGLRETSALDKETAGRGLLMSCADCRVSLAPPPASRRARAAHDAYEQHLQASARSTHARGCTRMHKHASHAPPFLAIPV